MSEEKKFWVENFTLDCGEMLTAEFSYRTYGTYHPLESNAVVVFHALTGNNDPAEWWSGIIGEGKLIDPGKYFIICVNFLGSSYGSTGPESIDPETGNPYHEKFPEITIRDLARQHRALLDSLGIDRVKCGIGGSMGGMVLLELAILAPELFEKIIPISVSDCHSAWRLAFSTTIRKTIHEFGAIGDYQKGMHLARQIAMTSYRSSREFDGRFGRDRHKEKFEIENYLEHQGEKIVSRFSPHSYITLTRAMELYDIRDRIHTIKAETLFIGCTTDILYSENEIRDIGLKLPNGTYHSLDAPFGHDSFLVAQEKLAKIITPFITSTVLKKEEVFA